MTTAKPASACSRLDEACVQRTDRDQTAGGHYEDDGVAVVPDLIASVEGRLNCDGDILLPPPEGRDKVRREAAVETTDLERRVLALERILQALIAHMAETEPRFIDRLSLNFTDSIRVAQQEHDHIDTASYAERFIREVMRLGEQPGIRTPRNFQNPKRAEQRLVAPPEIPGRPQIVFELRHRSGIWEVTRDGRFYGDFLSEKEALDSAEAAVKSVVADGGRATISDAVVEL